MEFRLKENVNTRDIFDYMKRLSFPYHYNVEYSAWERSYLSDVDGQNRALFRELKTIGAYQNQELIGFIQFGQTALGFDDRGEVSDQISYLVIRNFYFNQGQSKAGIALLEQAKQALSDIYNRIYAFFHYFGMSCYARHGKLFENFTYITEFLLEQGFQIEHENIFYSSVLEKDITNTEVQINWNHITLGRQRDCQFVIEGNSVGGCEIHFLEDTRIAYLRWIYINEDLCGSGLGTKCMTALKCELYRMGIKRFDTDTTLMNRTAQYFYEKNLFTKEGITRSFFYDVKEKQHEYLGCNKK